MGFLQLLRHHPRAIGFGFLQTFFSGLGQTHFVSLYTPLIMSSFALSATEYGSLYSFITLLSGFTITFVGPWIDRSDARLFAGGIGVGLILSLLLMLPLQNLWMVGAGLFGLRLFGQGLCSSLASITVARYFEEGRGKALSLSQLGFPVYEGLITPLGALLMAQWPFTQYMLFLIGSTLVIFLPLSLFLTRPLPRFNRVKASDHVMSATDSSSKKSWTRKEVLQSGQVYLLIPQVLMPPFALTGLFFHQALIADMKSWSLPLMASGLFFFALGRIFNTFVTGPLVDRHSAIRLFPYYQLPLSIGFLVLGLGTATWTPALCFLLFGLSVGSGGPIKSAIWAELYGIQHLGAIKSLFATLMIFSTAASPVLFGWILDQSNSPAGLLNGLFAASLLASLLSYLALQKTS